MAPAESTAAILRAQRMNRDIAIWARGIDREQFNPERRDMEWRRSLGHRRRRDGHRLPRPDRDGKGPRRLRRRDPRASRRAAFKHRVLVIGEGPARPWFEEQLPDAIFTGQQTGDDLARALASADVLPQSVDHRGVRQRHAGGDGLRACRSSPPKRPGATNLVRDGDDRHAGRRRATSTNSPMRSQPMRAIRSCAAAMARPASTSPRRWTGTRSIGRDPRLQARDRQARSGWRG